MRTKLAGIVAMVGISAIGIVATPVAAAAAALPEHNVTVGTVRPMDPPCESAPELESVKSNGAVQLALVRNCSYYTIKAHVGYSLPSQPGQQIYTSCVSMSGDSSHTFTIPLSAFGITAEAC